MLIADLYADMPHEPGNPLVQASYRRYLQEITEQYEFAVEWLGLRVEPWPHAGEPYRDSREMIEDVRHDRHLYFLATHASDEADTHHPMRAPTGIVLDGIDLPADDVFRVVHNVFGHAKEGHEFGPAGEERAWLEHYGMFSPLARPALTAETRGRTCWRYYGPHLRDTGGTRPYAEKAGLLPAEVSGVRLTREPGTGRVRAEPLAGWRPDTCRTLRANRRPVTADDRQTTFRVLAATGPIEVHVGRRCPDLDDLVRREGAFCWAYLTAANPGGRELSATENRRRDWALRHRLRTIAGKVLPGIGDDPRPADGLLAVGLDRSTAAALGADFGRDSIVVGDVGARAELLSCR